MSKVTLQRPYPTMVLAPPVLVTCHNPLGNPNIVAIANVFRLSFNPPVMGITIQQGKHSYELISQTQEFTINFPSTDLVRQVDLCGNVSGKDVDKFALSGLTPVPATQVRSPLIAECPVNQECRVFQTVTIGNNVAFLAEVVAEHFDGTVLQGQNSLNLEQLHPLLYCRNSGEYWSLGQVIGKRGCGGKG